MYFVNHDVLALVARPTTLVIIAEHLNGPLGKFALNSLHVHGVAAPAFKLKKEPHLHDHYTLRLAFNYSLYTGCF